MSEPRDDSASALIADAEVLHQARRILDERFRRGKYDHVADGVRRAAQELISRSRHPSRNPLILADDSLTEAERETLEGQMAITREEAERMLGDTPDALRDRRPAGRRPAAW